MNYIDGIKILRPHQWLKNLILFFPPFLGGVIQDPGVLKSGILPFISFCFASSFIYVVNDILDRKNDSRHPEKMLRPLPAGKIRPCEAWTFAGILLILSIVISLFVSTVFVVTQSSYVVLFMAYSLKLKEIPLFDIFCITGGFLLRLQAGGEAFGIGISGWLFLCVFFLSLFLSAGKRLNERNMLGHKAIAHRKSLKRYPDGFLEGILFFSSASVLVTYTIYSLPKKPLQYTVPVCTFGLLRYVFRVRAGLGGDPTEALIKDPPLLLTGLIWTIMVGWSIYK
jgi:decaprenyl-phosphate phosphoribosyltransferase